MVNLRGRPSTFRKYKELLEVNRLITGTLDRQAILPVVVERAARMLDGVAAVLLMRDANDDLRIAASYNVPVEHSAELRFHVGPGTMATIYGLCPGTSPAAFVGVPMLLREEMVGVLAVYRRSEHRASLEDEELLSALADQAAIAIENASLFDSASRAVYLQDVLTSIQDPVFVTDESGAVVLTNQAGLDLLGVPDRQSLNRPLSDWAAPYEVRDAAGQALAVEDMPIGRALRGETFSAMEARFRNLRDGSEIWTTVSGAPLRDSAGNITGCVVALKDISVLKRFEVERERLLTEAQRQVVEQDTIFSSITEGLIVFDVNSVPLKANRTAIEALGFDPAAADLPTSFSGIP